MMRGAARNKVKHPNRAPMRRRRAAWAVVMMAAARSSLGGTQLSNSTVAATHGKLDLASYTLELGLNISAAGAVGIGLEAQLLLQASLHSLQCRERVLTEGEEANRSVLCRRACRSCMHLLHTCIVFHFMY